MLLLIFLWLRLYYEKSDPTWKLELTTRSKEPTHCLLKTAVLVFSSPSHSVFSLFQRPACDENLSFFIRLLLKKPPAMVSGPAGNTTQFWSGGGRLLNDGDESDVKACNSRTHTHNTKIKIIYLFTSLISGIYNVSYPNQREKESRKRIALTRT